MFNVTDSALESLARALDRVEEPKPDNACFRVVPTEDGRLTLTIGVPNPQDTEYEQAGTTVLVVSEEIRVRCEGRTLDTDETGNLLLM